MSVFISYSHGDKAFANRLSANLMTRKVRVWVDTWELKAGDSLISKVQDALEGATAIVVLISPSSLESEWCKRELNSGLLREMEERRVVVVPAVIEDCELPLFLREKLYADFRTDFDEGFSQVLEAIASVTNERQDRIVRPDFHTDWSVDWGETDAGQFRLRITLVEHGIDLPFSIVTEVNVVANHAASRRQEQYQSAGVGWWGRRMILEMLSDHLEKVPMQITLDDQHPVETKTIFVDKKLSYEHVVSTATRRLGEDTGKSIFVDVGGQLQIICRGSSDKVREPNSEERVTIHKLLSMQ